ncbi:MoeZ/MoeB domain containing protein [Tritrichomonas foetus]|uniref:MoeZ/MoeB domain containing protein n=1 Tax=Tritrichomonas foetus TaxID=1144522 RepID=A0A1J4K4Q7_9EUKA|nr:MoeZ/MoeB domain containing protein [Tritrichomonas foetus]|eukprot:OHT06179.1 MoeZ/MoeB domain containing protein [Tritrichomonas foetus]
MDDNDFSTLYSRQLPVYGEEGQKKLKEATVLIVGCGGLGSSVSTILSRSGVGHLVLVDDDIVSISNIHRQFLYTHADVGNNKCECAAVSPLLCLSKNTPVCIHATASEIGQLIAQYKPTVVMDCTDNFAVRYAINTACVEANLPMVYGSVTREEGQISVFYHNSEYPTCPCFECIHPEKPKQMDRPPPVIPAICSFVATIQAQQAISLIIGVGDILIGQMATVNLFKLKIRQYKLKERDPKCKTCGVIEE